MPLSDDDSAGPADPGVHLYAADLISHHNGTKASVRLGIGNCLVVECDGPLGDFHDTDRLIAMLQSARDVQRERQRSQERRP